eukprot:1137795-Pelagomonas_calceolata.AAC.6
MHANERDLRSAVLLSKAASQQSSYLHVHTCAMVPEQLRLSPCVEATVPAHCVHAAGYLSCQAETQEVKTYRIGLSAHAHSCSLIYLFILPSAVPRKLPP